MRSLTTPVLEVRRNLPGLLSQSLDKVAASGYCQEWNRAMTAVQEQHSDTKTIFREALLVTQKLNRSHRIDQRTRKEINQLILRSFSKREGDTPELKDKPAVDTSANEKHILARFLNAVRDGYDTRLGRPNQFIHDFQSRLSSMKISFDSVRVLKNWSSERAITPNFNEIPSADMRTIVDQLYIINELQFGSAAADIILSDAILTAETQAKSGQLSIRDLL